VSALGLRDGPVHADVRIAGDATVVIEVAARSIGGLCSQVIRLVCDDAPDDERSLEEVILRQALGLPLGTVRMSEGACGVLMLPISSAGVLRGVAGMDRASELDGISGVTIGVPVGERVTPLPEGDRYLGFVFARGVTPAEVEATLRGAQQVLAIDIAEP
jgi:hypothetical protein